MVDEVAPDRVVAVCLDRDFDFRPDAVSARTRIGFSRPGGTLNIPPKPPNPPRTPDVNVDSTSFFIRFFAAFEASRSTPALP